MHQAEIERIIALVRGTVRSRLRRWKGHLVDGQDEDDLVNEVLAWLIEDEYAAIRAYDPSRGPLEKYLRSLTLGRIKDRERKYLRRRELEDEHGPANVASHEADPEAWMRMSDDNAVIQDWLTHRASPADQRIFQLAFVENRSHAEIAKELGVTKARVADRLCAIRKHIDHRLADKTRETK